MSHAKIAIRVIRRYRSLIAPEKMQRVPIDAALELFICQQAVNGARCIVVVAPTLESGDPDIANCRAFRSNAGQGFIYGPNVWHCPLRVLDEEGKFVVVMYLAGSDDEEFLTLPQKITIS